MKLIENAEWSIPESDGAMERAARARQDSLTKPPGSLGRLEDVAVQMAAFQATETPRVRPCAALIFAADHPVTRHGISPYPSAVTRAMLDNFRQGGAAAAVLARWHDIPLHVLDVGVDASGADLQEAAHGSTIGATLHRMTPGAEAGDIREADALSPDAFARCLDFGKWAVATHCRDHRLVILGEMGIGNTTVAAAVAAKLLEVSDPMDLVGAGTGATGQIFASKRDVVRDVVARLKGEAAPLEILRRAGGRELAAMYGAMRAALRQRSIVLVDGFIVTVVAAVLARTEPSARAGMIFAHRSRERGHAVLLEALQATPLLDIGLCLGEASGALAAFALLDSACALHNTMATFESANVPGALP